MSTTIDWDDTYRNNRDFQALNTADLEWMLSHTNVSKGSKALDVGCGTGQLARDLYHRGFDVQGIDISNQAILIANQSTVYAEQGINFSVANIEQGLNVDNMYDFVICKYVYAFLEDKIGTLSKIKTTMNSDSLFVIITPDIEALPSPKKHIAIDHKEIMAQLSAEFDNIRYEKRSNDMYYFLKL